MTRNVSLYQTDYDLSQCRVGIVHIGYGAFHRSHQAVYIDDMMQATGVLDWGIAAVNLRTLDSAGFALLAQQEAGYIVKSISADGRCGYRLVRSHLAFVDAVREADKAYDLLADEGVKIVSVTVTESGYALSEPHEGPASEGQAGESGETIYSYLSAALERRRQKLGAPLTILCCDNIRSNGAVLEGALKAYIEAMGDLDLLSWVSEHVRFPCSMVDRITPRSTPALEREIAEVFPEVFAEVFAGSSAWLQASAVHAEDFTQWVIEDNFASVKPPLAAVGVEIVADVVPFEEAKIRILNGGHTGLAYLGALRGYRTFDEAMRDADLRHHFDRWQDEVLAGLGNGLPFDTRAYLDEVALRFSNAGMADSLERICMDGYSKMGLYIKPTLESCLEQGIVPVSGYACIASWVIYGRQHRDGLGSVPYDEPYWERLAPMLAPGREALLASDSGLWGALPERFEGFVPGLVAAIESMSEKWSQT